MSTPLPEHHSDELPPNFTPRAQQVLALARTEAHRLNHSFVGTEHVLLGLIRFGQGTAITVLRRSGVDLETIRLEIEKQVGTGPGENPEWSTPYTPRVKKALALAAREAMALKHTYVGTEHILLGLLREGDGVAPKVLKNLGLDLDKTRAEILRELDPNSTSTAPQKAEPAKPQSDLVDVGRRYDVYCTERNQEVVVYRNALFKAKKSLFRFDALEFVEIELPDTRTVFVSRFSIIKFCEPGTHPGGESVSGRQP